MDAGVAARRWLAGLVLGGGLTFALLSTLYPLGILLLIALLAWTALKREALAAAGGALIGFGSVTLALFLVANAQCPVPGTCYESSPALLAAAALVIAGLGLTVIVVRRAS
jgi:hypothetical protein